MRVLGVLAVVVLAGCASAPADVVLRYEGAGCTEVGLSLPLPGEAAQRLLPLGYTALPARALAPEMPEGAALAVVAVNHCAFRFGDAQVTEPEAFLWLYVVPPAQQRLPGDAHHTFELARWRMPGPGLEALRGAQDGVAPARVEGVPSEGFGPNASFHLVVAPEAGGNVTLSGSAGAFEGLLDHPEGPCCRTFARRAGGLVATDTTATDQRRALGTCALSASAEPLAALLGPGTLQGPCSVNAPFDFRAEVRRVP